MQAVILAAGRGERMGALTENTPKPLLEVCGTSLLQYKLDILPNDVDEIVIVVGYLGSAIQKKFGGVYKDKKIFYVEQGPKRGTAGALSYAAPILRDRFLVFMGDDLYSKEDVIAAATKEDGWSLVVADQSEVRAGGSVRVEKGCVKEIIENHGVGGAKGLVSTNLFVLDTRIFAQPLIPKERGSEEYGLPQTVLAATEALGIPLYAIRAHFWIQITEPSDLEKAEKMLAFS